jgi:phosphoribosylformylglycinamidine cyclo-ligase
VAESYESRGVSADKRDVHAAIAGLDHGLFPGAFCRIVADPSGDPAWAGVLHADGAGTKTIVAYLRWRETGRADVFAGIAQDSAVMNVDDVACVGVADGLVLSNAIARNAHRVDGAVVAAIVRGYERFTDRLRALGVGIALAGGETADVGDLVQTLVVDSTVFARVRRDAILDASRLRGGEAIVGLSSTGRATYEDDDNSGIGANGLTLARHVLLRHEYGERFPETWSPTIPAERVYQGPFALDDPLPGAACTVGDALLAPTRTYAPAIAAVLARHRARVRAIVHCTGGGQTKCLRFGSGLHFVKDALFPLPPLFRAIMDTGRIPLREMLQVFNMGHRMELYCEPAIADDVVASAARFGIVAQVVGRVERATGARNRLTIVAHGSEIAYDAPE